MHGYLLLVLKRQRYKEAVQASGNFTHLYSIFYLLLISSRNAYAVMLCLHLLWDRDRCSPQIRSFRAGRIRGQGTVECQAGRTDCHQSLKKADIRFFILINI